MASQADREMAPRVGDTVMALWPREAPVPDGWARSTFTPTLIVRVWTKGDALPAGARLVGTGRRAR